MIGIMRQDLEAVSHLLNTSPLSVFETNYCGQTPVHIAVLAGNASILKLVLSFSNEKLLNTADTYGAYPIDYLTLRQLHKTCHSQPVSDCEGCVMSEALLNAGSRLFPSTLSIGLGGENQDTSDLSFAVGKIFLRHLKERRTRLQDLAAKHLPKDQQREQISSENYILDRNASKVQKLLEERSIYVPSYLKVDEGHEITRTIYDYIKDRHTAKFAWKLGFRDLGTDSMYGFYEVLDEVLVDRETEQLIEHNLIGFASWLVDRGLDLGLPIPASVLSPLHSDLRSTGAHYVMTLLGRRAAYYNTALILPKGLSKTVFSQFTVDSCSCLCSTSGCNPLMKYFDCLRNEYSRVDGDYLWNLPLMCKEALKLVTKSERQAASYAWVYRAVLRRITFDALSLRHSCCDVFLWRNRRYSDEDDFVESWVEEEDRLLLFENLCVEFETKCSGNSKLVQFVRDTWYPRMIYELEQLERQEMERRLTEEERLAAEEIGVIWDSDSSEISMSEDEDDRGTLGYYKRILDGIAPEPDIHLPYGIGLS